MHTVRAIFATNLLLITSWAWLHVGSLSWLIQTLTQPDSELNLALALGLAAMTLWHVDITAAVRRLTHLPEHNVAAGILVLLGAIALSADPLPLQPVRAALCGLGAYGLLGLYCPRDTWTRARPAVALAVTLMPISTYLDIYLGFPARHLTAEAVAGLLQIADIPHINSGVVLTLEGGAAYVDLPCAGVRSLWTGAVFLLGAAMLEGLTVDLRFLVVSAVSTAMLLLVNVARVAAIVWIDFVWGQPLLAEVLHAPMGVLGFVLCCGLAWSLLTAGKPTKQQGSRGLTAPSSRKHSGFWALIPVLWMLAGPNEAVSPAAASTPEIIAPADMHMLPLTAAERRFAQSQGGQILKLAFARGTLTGTVVLVTSRSWTAQHLPRHCLQAAGVTVEREAPTPVDGENVRWATVHFAQREGRAAWWFQSETQRTDDHTARIWAGLGDDTPWTLVSVLFEQPVNPDEAHVTSLIADLRIHLEHSLESP